MHFIWANKSANTKVIKSYGPKLWEKLYKAQETSTLSKWHHRGRKQQRKWEKESPKEIGILGQRAQSLSPRPEIGAMKAGEIKGSNCGS